MEAKSSDAVDLLQTVYLASCDYLITDDKRYQDLINNNPFADYLAGRAIDTDTFLKMISEGPIFKSKKAAFPASRLKFN
jgi:hypothetical protein